MKLGLLFKTVGRVFLIASLIAVLSSTSYADILSTGEDHADEKHFVMFAGGTASGLGWFSYLGGVYAPFSDIRESGFLVRGFFGGGEYDYDVGQCLGGPPCTTTNVNIDGEVLTGDLMVGYQFVVNRFVLRVFAGGNIADHDINPNDPGNPLTGTEGGGKGQLELFIPMGQSLWTSIMGSYATTNEDYWSRARIGYQVTNRISVGPEGVFLGNERFDTYKVGGFVSVGLTDDLSAVASGGYLNNTSEGDSGYGSLGLAIQF